MPGNLIPVKLWYLSYIQSKNGHLASPWCLPYLTPFASKGVNIHGLQEVSIPATRIYVRGWQVSICSEFEGCWGRPATIPHVTWCDSVCQHWSNRSVTQSYNAVVQLLAISVNHTFSNVCSERDTDIVCKGRLKIANWCDIRALIFDTLIASFMVMCQLW